MPSNPKPTSRTHSLHAAAALRSTPTLTAHTLNSEKDIKFSATTWASLRTIAIMVVCVVLMILSIPVCLLESLRRHIATMNASAAIAASSRELQLVGSVNRSLGAPPHRPRRPCRAPSQVSAASLPAYMKEPRDQDLVVSRGPDGEDVAASVDDNTHADNINITPPARAYSHMPRLPTESSLLVGYSTTPDPRGDPPAYFEVVEHDDNILHHSISVNDYPPGIPAPSPAPPRGFFASILSSPPPPVPSTSTSTSPLALAHTRTNSTSLTTAPYNRGHRPSTSSSTLFSLARKKSSASPYDGTPGGSAISLASISHPLPHPLLKTEFSALPRGEQLKVISGTREGGVERFGVPFWEAAVRYAASVNASRVDLGEDLPPGWEDVAESSGVGEGSGSGVDEGTRILDPPQIPVPPSPTTAEHRASGAPSLSTPDSRDALSTPDRRASGHSVQSFVTAPEHEADDDSDDGEGGGGNGSVIRIRVQEPTDGTMRPEEYHAPAA
ncbi:hypothetical protein C8J57DRAFT_1732173 [Mycena rebaudengoi]|nr:hypothetical protein C8J57DRAFT_1732173 [Mycena rebaudengoi]